MDEAKEALEKFVEAGGYYCCSFFDDKDLMASSFVLKYEQLILHQCVVSDELYKGYSKAVDHMIQQLEGIPEGEVIQ